MFSLDLENSFFYFLNLIHFKVFIHLIFRFFFEFLLLHARTIAGEIHDEYVETTSKVYNSYFQSYTRQLWKLQVIYAYFIVPLKLSLIYYYLSFCLLIIQTFSLFCIESFKLTNNMMYLP